MSNVQSIASYHAKRYVSSVSWFGVRCLYNIARGFCRYRSGYQKDASSTPPKGSSIMLFRRYLLVQIAVQCLYCAFSIMFFEVQRCLYKVYIILHYKTTYNRMHTRSLALSVCRNIPVEVVQQLDACGVRVRIPGYISYL